MHTETGKRNKKVDYKINQSAIVIPVYKSFESLVESDKVSLYSILINFRDENIVFLLPDSLPELSYLNLCSSYYINPIFIKFDDCFFENKDSYSRLLVSTHFYERFKNYRFILICQTDVFVFKNELRKWINRNYSYIGAPWVKRDLKGNIKITGAGNGGFSLRKVGDFIKLTRKIKYLQVLNNVWKQSFIFRKIPFGIFLRVVGAPVWLKCRINKYTFYLSEDHLQNEDRYWCEWVSQVFQDFKNAPPWISLSFAIEEEPRVLINELAGELPFGCHAWAINDPEFWKQYIYK